MQILEYLWTLILPVGFAAVFSFKIVEGETCSAMTRAAAGDDLTALRNKAFAAFRSACRKKKERQPDQITSCSFSTEASYPHSFTFILDSLTVPFRLDFTVKTARSAAIALAENKTDGSIFAEITIGGKHNKWAVIRPCNYKECLDQIVTHEENGLVHVNEYRPFWIEYKEGVVTVGKGGQEEAFLEWDAGAYHQRVPTQVHVGIASWEKANGDWVFYHQLCE